MTAAEPLPNTVRGKAFAKINLTLQVLGVRDDGYHELATRFQSLALHDSLVFTAHDGPFHLTCDDPACPSDSTNLVWRAAERMWRAAGRRSAVAGVRVRIAKRIPMQAGLGGGSSDAAVAVRALAKLWRLNLSAPRLQRIASELGADVPYFLEGGTALGSARGNVLKPLPDDPPAWVVLALPAFGVSTVEAFGWWDADNPAGRRGARTSRSADTPANDLEASVARRHPEIRQLVTALGRLGAARAGMSGSGSAVFGLFRTRLLAVAAARSLGGRTLVTRTIDREKCQSAV